MGRPSEGRQSWECYGDVGLGIRISHPENKGISERKVRSHGEPDGETGDEGRGTELGSKELAAVQSRVWLPW